ncbi:hypothetical protein GUJ93_ZPchr0030g33472 [Zizania palustris]|uniref:Uncharacterized protein n=1 Tax=Zizania palustris TaxID=103762 RepID=A0A8J5QRT9_ZIZPA|nr:hypothetical protein GUJ93_ZPchr0030g33472 [Zizania palustris]
MIVNQHYPEVLDVGVEQGLRGAAVRDYRSHRARSPRLPRRTAVGGSSGLRASTRRSREGASRAAAPLARCAVHVREVRPRVRDSTVRHSGLGLGARALSVLGSWLAATCLAAGALLPSLLGVLAAVVLPGLLLGLGSWGDQEMADGDLGTGVLGIWGRTGEAENGRWMGGWVDSR